MAAAVARRAGHLGGAAARVTPRGQSTRAAPTHPSAFRAPRTTEVAALCVPRLGCISACISTASRLHLGGISAVSRRRYAERFKRRVVYDVFDAPLDLADEVRFGVVPGAAERRLSGGGRASFDAAMFPPRFTREPSSVSRRGNFGTE